MNAGGKVVVIVVRLWFDDWKKREAGAGQNNIESGFSICIKLKNTWKNPDKWAFLQLIRKKSKKDSKKCWLGLILVLYFNQQQEKQANTYINTN